MVTVGSDAELRREQGGKRREGKGREVGREKGTHVVSAVGAVEVERRLERDGGVRDEARDAEVVLGCGVWLRCGVSATGAEMRTGSGVGYHERVEEDHVTRVARELPVQCPDAAFSTACLTRTRSPCTGCKLASTNSLHVWMAQIDRLPSGS